MSATGIARHIPRQLPLLDDLDPLRSQARNPIIGVCTLASKELLDRLQGDEDLSSHAIVGPLTTENLGIEKIIRTAIASPSMRYVLLCGQEARGHYGGQGLLSLVERGLGDDGRIIGARGPRAQLVNVQVEDVERFRSQVSLIDMIGCEEPELIRNRVALCLSEYPGPFSTSAGRDVHEGEAAETTTLRAAYDPYRDWVADPLGYFVIEIDRGARELVCEHYLPSNELHVVVRAHSAAEMLHTLVQYQIVSRLDHAGYLGRELQKAEVAMNGALQYEQDKPLQVAPEDSAH